MRHLNTRASRLSSRNCEKSVKYSYTTISLRSPTKSGVKISVFYTRFRDCTYIFTFVLGFDAMEQFVSKNPQKCMFLVFVRLEIKTLKIKSQFYSKLLVILEGDMTRCSSILWKIKS